MIVPPESTIGIIGGGQLGRMLSIAAAQLGYRCHVFDPDERPCAADVSAKFIRGRFDDRAALERFAEECDVVTYEFENLDPDPLEAIGAKLRPGTQSLRIAQDRALEKEFVEACGARPAPWRRVDGAADVAAALDELGGAIILKTRRFGYDGKGQVRVRDAKRAEQAWDAIGRVPAVAEAHIDFQAEFSVVTARASDGATRAFPVPRNTHRDGILRHSVVPAGTSVEGLSQRGIEVAERMTEELGHVGVLTVEFFTTGDGPLVNEFAPRVHNSGHWTIEGAMTSQFEQHVRAICGLPLGPAELVGTGATMDNLIGNDVNDWARIAAEPGAHLHLYGKGEARPGRKMGHVTRVSHRA